MGFHSDNYTNLHCDVNASLHLTGHYPGLHTANMEFREWLIAQMDARQLTEQQIEDITEKNGEKVPQSGINRVKKGTTPDPRLSTVSALLRAFGIEIRTLFVVDGLKQVASVAATEEERELLFGFRQADPSTRRHMLRMAQDATSNFPMRSGIQGH